MSSFRGTSNTYRSRERDARSGDGASNVLVGRLDPFNSSLDSFGDAVGAGYVALEELGRGTDFLDEGLSILLIHIQHGNIASIGYNLLATASAKARSTVSVSTIVSGLRHNEKLALTLRK